MMSIWRPPMTYEHRDTLYQAHTKLMTFDTRDFLFLMTVESALWPEYKQKWSHPDSNWGPKNQNLICCPYTMEPFTMDSSEHFWCPWGLFPFKKQRAQSELNQWPRELQSYALPLSYAPSLCVPDYWLFTHATQMLTKTPPVGLEPTTLRLKAAHSTDWVRKATCQSLLLWHKRMPFFLWHKIR